MPCGLKINASTWEAEAGGSLSSSFMYGWCSLFVIQHVECGDQSLNNPTQKVCAMRDTASNK